MPSTHAYILAAGLGTRLAPLTLERPKPLVEVLGTPLIRHALSLLVDAGVTHVALNTHHLHEKLSAALAGGHPGLKQLVVVHEPEILGTGGGLKGMLRAMPPPPSARVLFLNADALIDLDVAGLVAADAKVDARATLVLRDDPEVQRYGAIGTDDEERIRTFAGRVPYDGKIARERMFCGVHLADPTVLDVLPEGFSCINKEGYPHHMKAGARLQAFHHEGYFCDVGTPERLLEANLALLAGTVRVRHMKPFAPFAHEGPIDDDGPVLGQATWRGSGVVVDPSAVLVPPLLLDDGAVVEAGATVGPFAVVGKAARIARGSTVSRAVVQSGTLVEGRVTDAVVGPTCSLPVAPSVVDAVVPHS